MRRRLPDAPGSRRGDRVCDAAASISFQRQIIGYCRACFGGRFRSVALHVFSGVRNSPRIQISVIGGAGFNIDGASVANSRLAVHNLSPHYVAEYPHGSRGRISFATRQDRLHGKNYLGVAALRGEYLFRESALLLSLLFARKFQRAALVCEHAQTAAAAL